MRKCKKYYFQLWSWHPESLADDITYRKQVIIYGIQWMLSLYCQRLYVEPGSAIVHFLFCLIIHSSHCEWRWTSGSEVSTSRGSRARLNSILARTVGSTKLQHIVLWKKFARAPKFNFEYKFPDSVSGVPSSSVDVFLFSACTLSNGRLCYDAWVMLSETPGDEKKRCTLQAMLHTWKRYTKG